MSNRRPVVGELITAGVSPITAHLELKVLSPTGVINRNIGGIGLGIVAALEEIPAKTAGFSCRNRMWSDPVPVARSRNVGDGRKMDKVCCLGEDYTIVSSNKAKKSPANRGKDCLFNISPARFADGDMKVPQPEGFLSSCYLCSKKLHGKDIYMYRGEKAFCSPECRNRQMAMDERPEKYCGSQASSSGAGRVIATGIFAI